MRLCMARCLRSTAVRHGGRRAPKSPPEDWKDVHAYRDRSGQSYDAADVLGAGGVQAEGERRRWSGFAEALLPVRHNWYVALAGTP